MTSSRMAIRWPIMRDADCSLNTPLMFFKRACQARLTCAGLFIFLCTLSQSNLCDCSAKSTRAISSAWLKPLSLRRCGCMGMAPANTYGSPVSSGCGTKSNTYCGTCRGCDNTQTPASWGCKLHRACPFYTYDAADQPRGALPCASSTLIQQNAKIYNDARPYTNTIMRLSCEERNAQ